MDDKQGTPVAIYLDTEEMKAVMKVKRHYGFSNKNMAVRKIIREYGGLKDTPFGGWKDD